MPALALEANHRDGERILPKCGRNDHPTQNEQDEPEGDEEGWWGRKYMPPKDVTPQPAGP